MIPIGNSFASEECTVEPSPRCVNVPSVFSRAIHTTMLTIRNELSGMRIYAVITMGTILVNVQMKKSKDSNSTERRV